jgi:hypothetical protein
MENKYFLLGPAENTKMVKAIQVVFGIVCFVIAGFWIVFNVRSLKADSTLWLTILFLSGFGFYMIWAGLGKAARFVETGTGKIRLKKTILLPVIELVAGDIQKIDLYPFKILFIPKTGKIITLRLSSTYYETNDKILEAVLIFAEDNSIELEEIEEKI